MKFYICFLVFITLFSIRLNAQKKTQKDSIFHLDQVTILPKEKSKKKIIKLDLNGGPSYNGLNQIKKIVSAVKNIPEGSISYVKFYFNTGLPNLFKKKLKIKYKDTELGILIYEIDKDGKPGKIISENEIKFVVKKEHKGGLKIDLKPLKLNYRELFIGVEVLSEQIKNQENIYVRFNEQKAASTYIIFTNAFSSYKKWVDYDPYRPTHFKLTLGIEQ